ncbi:MAG: serine/threonine-protein kinase [Myxococcota bacterium]
MADQPSPEPGLENQMVRARLREVLFGEPTEPVKIGRFVVLRKLGAGGMGAVYAAYDEDLDRKVAIKLLHAKMRAGRLRREAKAMAQLSHPNVVPVFDVGVYGEDVFVAMEFIDGPTLRAWVAAEQRPWKDVLACFLDAGRGLAAAHGASIVHRDFKPDNVMLGNDGRARVLDFGLAQPTGDEVTAPIGSPTSLNDTETATLAGTPAYMAPEQFLGGPVDAKSDQFAFCVSLWEALYGARPFASDSFEALKDAVCSGRRTSTTRAASVPTWLRLHLERGLAVDPSERFGSMDALLDALAHDPGVVRRRRLAIAATVAVATGASIAGYLQSRDRGPRCAEVETLFDQDDRDRVREVLTGADWQALEPELDAYARRWTETQAQACEASQVDAVAARTLEQGRLRCLHWQRQEFEALLDVFADGRAAGTAAVEGVRSLREVSLCENDQRIRSLPTPPENPEVLREIQTLRPQLARAVALESTGDIDGALVVAEEVAARAVALGYRPLEAEALVLTGHIQRFRDPAASEEALLAGRNAAEAGGSDVLVAEASVALGFVVGYKLGRIREGIEHTRHGEASLERIGSDADLELGILLNHSAFAAAEGRWEGYLHYSEKILARTETADSLHNVCLALGQIGRLDEAIEIGTRAVELDSSWWLAQGSLALALVHAGHPVRAQAHAEAAVEAARARKISLAWPEGVLRLTRHAQGDRSMAPERIETLRTPPLVSSAHAGPALSATEHGMELLHYGEPQRAKAFFERALELFDRCCEEQRPKARALNGLGLVYLAQGQPELALEPLEQALALVEAKPRRPGDDAQVRFALARALRETATDPERALALARAARAGLAGLGPGFDARSAEIDAWIEAGVVSP